MNKFEENIINKISYFNKSDKEFFLENQDDLIDTWIRNLTNAINSIDFLTTMNSCQGALIKEEATNHCPLTYVDFYVLDHEYQLVNLLMVKLVSEFGDQLECKVSFEADVDFIDENEVEENGQVNFRYRIELREMDIYEDVVKSVYEFAEGI